MAKKRRGVSGKSVHRSILNHDCDELEQFIESMHSTMRSGCKRFDAYARRQIEAAAPHRQSEFAQWLAEDAHNLSVRYPRLLWQSVFVSLFSLFDKQMGDFCRRIRHVAQVNGIVRATKHEGRATRDDSKGLPGEKCLRRFGVRLATKSREWKKLRSLESVRNVIVHNRGRLRKSDDDRDSKAVRAFARRAKSLKLEDGREIVVTMELCVEMAKLIRLLLNKTLNAIPQQLFAIHPSVRKSVVQPQVAPLGSPLASPS